MFLRPHPPNLHSQLRLRTMMPLRWQAGARLPNRQMLSFPPSIAGSLAARRRCAPFRPQTATLGIHHLVPRRVRPRESRALEFTQRSYSGQSRFSGGRKDATTVPPRILQSAFPTKTVLFLVILGASVYYLVDDEPEWILKVMLSNQNEPSSHPLAFFASSDLDQWRRDLEEDDHISLLNHPDGLMHLNEQFWKLIGGWELDREDAKAMNIPATHGCRLRSNSPCVS